MNSNNQDQKKEHHYQPYNIKKNFKAHCEPLFVQKQITEIKWTNS